MKNIRVLFVCSENKLRSPTAESVFSEFAGFEAIGAGTNPDAERPVTTELIEWADAILVMENHHRKELQRRFEVALEGKRLAVLGIPDEYDRMDPVLIQLLKEKVVWLL